jgi:hypothetical protein
LQNGLQNVHYYDSFVVQYGLFQEGQVSSLSSRSHCSRTSPSGEIGRHIGLKIRRFPEKGRAGSIPASGTNTLFYIVLFFLKTRMFPSMAGFLLSCAFVGPIADLLALAQLSRRRLENCRIPLF